MSNPVRSATLPKLRQAIKHSGRDPESHRSLNVTGTGGKIDVCSNLDFDFGSYGGYVTSRQPHATLEARLQQKKHKDELISDSEIEYMIREKLRKEQYAIECMFRNADPNRCGKVHRNALLRILYSICGHIRFEQFHRLLDRLGLDDKQTVSFADFKASFAESTGSQRQEQLTVSMDCDATAMAGPLIGRYSTKPVSVPHAFTMLRQRAAQTGFDPREILPPACFEPGGVVLKPQLRQALTLLRIPLATGDLDKFWERFDTQGTGAVGTSQLLLLLGLSPTGKQMLSDTAKPCRQQQRSKTAPARKLAASTQHTTGGEADVSSSSCGEIAKNPAALTATNDEPNIKCQISESAGPVTTAGELKYLKRFETLRKNRPNFDHFLDDLHYRFEEPYNALLVALRHSDAKQSGLVTATCLRQILHDFGFPTATEADFDQFLLRFGLRASCGSQAAVSYSELLSRLYSRGSNSLLARYLVSDKSPLMSTETGQSDSLSPYQMELQLLRFLHREYLLIHCGFLREDPQKTGLISQDGFRSVLGRVLKPAEMPAVQLVDALTRLPRSSSGGVQYRAFLEMFHIPPNTWAKQPAMVLLQRTAAPNGDEQLQIIEICPQQQQQPQAAEQNASQDQVPVRTLVEVSQLAQSALSAHFHQVDKLYKQMDRRNTGRLTHSQFWSLLNALGLRVTEAEIQALWATLDTNADGQWSYRQMLRHFMTNLHERALEKMRAARSWQRNTMDPNVIQLRQHRLAAAVAAGAAMDSGATQESQELTKPSPASQPGSKSSKRQLEDLIDKCRQQVAANWDMIKNCLRRLDPQGTSCIQRAEFTALASEFRLPLNSEEVELVSAAFEKHGSASFNYIAFLKRFVSHSAKSTSRTEELAHSVTDKKQGNRVRIAHIVDAIRDKLLFEWQSLLLAFRKFDTEKTGRLSLHELRKIVNQCGYSLSNDDLFLVLTEFDLDFDGMINYQEFVRQLLDVAQANQSINQ